MYTDPSCKPWTSGSWAPPGFASRWDLVKQVPAVEATKPPMTVGAEERVEKVEPENRREEEVV